MTRLGLCVVAAATVVLAATPAGAATPAPQSIVLAGTASCRWGDVDITYAANGATRRSVSFTAADGAVLYQVEGKSLGPDFSGTEHVLAEAKQAQAPGSLLGVHVTVGTTPPAADTTAEFFVLYRCSPDGNDKGGTNAIVQECHGPFGTCPTTAAGAVASPAPSTATPATTAAPTGDPNTPEAAGGGADGGTPSSGSTGSVAPGATVTGAPGSEGSTPVGTASAGSTPGATSADNASTSPSPAAWLIPTGLAVLAVLAAVAGVIVRRRPS